MDNIEENNTEVKQISSDLALQYADRIKQFQMKPKTRVYLVSNKFLKGLESFPETNRAPKIQNSELKNALSSLNTSSTKNKNKKKKSKNPQINKDFYPVDENLWNDLITDFGGGPEISYYVCDDGTIDYSNFQIFVKCGTEKKCIQTSMKTDLQTFHFLVLNAFGIDIDEKYKLCFNNSPTPISTDGTVGGRIANEKLLILTVHYPENAPERPKPVQPPKHDIKQKENTNKPAENSKPEDSRPLGLKNTGNSCYMNSVIQCFASVDHLSHNLNSLRAEADYTLDTVEHLGPDKNLRGLSAKLHLGQYKTTTAFISLISNLKNKIPEKVDTDFNWKPARSSKGGKNKKYVRNMTRNMKFNSHSKFQTAIHLKRTMSLFSNNQQQDAHEFFSFLLDAVHDECPKSIENFFYGKCKRTTTCALCGHQSVIVEDFSSLSLPIAMARKVLYSPYDLNKQLQRIQSIPENLSDKLVLIGKTRKGNKVVTKMSPDFIEVIALEIPDLSDANQNPTSNETENAIISQSSAHQDFENIDPFEGEDDNEEEENNETEDNQDETQENQVNDENKESQPTNNNETNENTSTNNNETTENTSTNNNETNENTSTNNNETNENTSTNNNETNENTSTNNNETTENKSTNNSDENKLTNTDDESQTSKINETNENQTDNNNEINDGGECDADENKDNQEFGVALLRVVNKKTNEKTLPILIKVPLNVQLSEDEIREIVRERLIPILEQPDCDIKLLAPPKIFAKDNDKPFCRFPLSCQVTSPLKPNRLETLFTKSEIPISVDELLDSFFSKMQLDEDNMWLCEVCKNNSCAYQQVQLLDTPDKQDSSSTNAPELADDQTAEPSKVQNAESTATANEDIKETNENQNAETATSNNENKETNENQNAETATSNNGNKETNENQNAETATSNKENKETNENQNAETATSNNENKDANEQNEANNSQNTESATANDDSKIANENPSTDANESSAAASEEAGDANEVPTPSENQSAAKSFHLPECLVLHLKRFIAKNGRLSRDPTTVIIPHYINISRFIERDETAAQSADENDSRYTYKLVSVSNHAGSLSGGHYTAYGERDGKWFTFNDMVVSVNSNIFNEKSNDRFGSSNAYLLFYSKVEQ